MQISGTLDPERSWDLEKEMQADAAQADASEQIATERTRHLLASYSHILPANPRLIRRVVNSWGMLDALNKHVSHNEPEDVVVRAAIFTVRFPTMTDELLVGTSPIRIDEILDPAYVGPWSQSEVLAVLRTENGQLIEPENLGRCFGRQYRELPPELVRSVPTVG